MTKEQIKQCEILKSYGSKEAQIKLLEDIHNKQKEWSVIEEAPHFSVSNYGDVRNDKTGRILKGTINKEGYRTYNLQNEEGKRIYRLGHRLAAEAFLGKPVGNQDLINHVDEDRLNNFVGTVENNYRDGNLEWCDRQYNRIYSIKLHETDKDYAPQDRRPIHVYTKETLEYVGVFKNAPTIIKELFDNEGNDRLIYQAIKGQRKYYKGFYFTRDPETDERLAELVAKKGNV